MTTFPDHKNIYGTFFAPDGLGPVLTAARRVEGVFGASIDTSAYNQAQKLRLSSDVIDFESEPLENYRHLFNGGVAGTIEEVIDFVFRLSTALAEANIQHHFEVYDEEQTLITEIPDKG